MKYSLAFNFVSEQHLSALISNFSSAGCERFFICGKSPAGSYQNTSVVGGYGIEFRQTLEEILNQIKTDWLLLLLKPVNVEPESPFAKWQAELDSGSAILGYSAHNIAAGQQQLTDYQSGSVRDDFDFGPLLFVNVSKAKKNSSDQSGSDNR